MKCLFTPHQCRCGFTSCYYSNTMIIEKSIHLDWCDEDLKATPNGVDICWCDEDLKATPNGVDIWEKDWHCYFTWEAAMREARSQGLRLPTKEEWEQSFDIIWEEKLFDFLKLNLAGYRGYSNGQYFNQGSYGFYWSSTPNGTFSYIATFHSGGGNIATSNLRWVGFSVRCLKD